VVFCVAGGGGRRHPDKQKRDPVEDAAAKWFYVPYQNKEPRPTGDGRWLVLKTLSGSGDVLKPKPQATDRSMTRPLRRRPTMGAMLDMILFLFCS
jgi:hypothetical protein